MKLHFKEMLVVMMIQKCFLESSGHKIQWDSGSSSPLLALEAFVFQELWNRSNRSCTKRMQHA